MFASNEYQLLDFGCGRKLERFGPFVLDRPCPAAKPPPARPRLWKKADSRFERTGSGRGAWQPNDVLPKSWMVRYGELRFELKPAPFGHVGLFPEQAENWDWIADQLRQVHAFAAGNLHGESGRRCKVLNLFAYTGGSTLAAAAAGAEVVHVDAARNTVAWARRNAEHSGLAHAPIRWIAEDAAKFVSRELRRGASYDAVILDPPSYGHDPRGKAWRIERDLPPLLHACLRLTEVKPKLLLFSCHSEEWTGKRLRKTLREQGINETAMAFSSANLDLARQDGEKISCGLAIRAVSQ
jgi:23S rRNA (cytosine1962-C5)-methyltransferase